MQENYFGADAQQNTNHSFFSIVMGLIDGILDSIFKLAIKKKKKCIIRNVHWHGWRTIAGSSGADRKRKCWDSMCTAGWPGWIWGPACPRPRQSAVPSEPEVHVILQRDKLAVRKTSQLMYKLRLFFCLICLFLLRIQKKTNQSSAFMMFSGLNLLVQSFPLLPQQHRSAFSL